MPDPQRQQQRIQLGLLGRLVRTPCALEPFRNTPGFREVCNCLGKLLAWWQILERQGGRRVGPPRLWVLSPGQAKTALLKFRFEAAARGTKGLYTVPHLGLGLVVLSELPEKPDTLALRLLGRGRTQRRALEELARLPPDAWERQQLLPVVVRLQFELPEDDPRKKEFLMNAKQTFEEFQTDLLERGRKQGREESRAEASQTFERFQTELLDQGREEGLKTALLTTLSTRFATVPDQARACIEAAHDGVLLKSWLPVAISGTLDQIVRQLAQDTAQAR